MDKQFQKFGRKSALSLLSIGIALCVCLFHQAPSAAQELPEEGVKRASASETVASEKGDVPTEAETASDGEVDPTSEAESESEDSEAEAQASVFEEDQRIPFNEGIDVMSEHETTYGSQTSFLEWHGYLAFEYDDEQGQNSNFDGHEFYLAAKAQVSDKVSFLAEMEFEHSGEKLILPIQAFGRYRATENHVFRAGLFFVPIGLPRAYTLRGNTNLLIRQVALTHDIMFENWAVLGVGGYGNLVRFNENNSISYDVAVSNGLRGMAPGDSWFDAIQTLTDHTEDNNNNKALSGRFAWVSNQFLGGKFNVGTSFAHQKYSPQNDGDLMMTHRALDVRYFGDSGFRVQAEWMDRTGDDNPADVANGVGADAFGWYVQVAKRFLAQKKFLNYIDVVAQVDAIDLFKEVDTNGDRRTIALGLNYSPEPYFIIKAEYDLVKEIHGEAIDNDKLWLSVVFEF